MIVFQDIPRRPAPPPRAPRLIRANLLQPEDIIDRMARDMIAVRKAEDSCGEQQLLDAGWTIGQVHMFNRRAADRARRLEAQDAKVAAPAGNRGGH